MSDVAGRQQSRGHEVERLRILGPATLHPVEQATSLRHDLVHLDTLDPNLKSVHQAAQ